MQAKPANYHPVLLPLLLTLIAAFGSAAAAQEMEPRAYSPAPVGMQFILLSFAHQSGDVLTDSALPLRDVSVKLNSASVGYGRTFGLLGRQAKVVVFVPYIRGRASGKVFEAQQEVTRSGLGDTLIRFS